VENFLVLIVESTVTMVDSLIRLENLRRLNKTAKELELAVGGRYTYWHDMLAGTKSFGEKAARKIEEKLGLVRGQMDQEHGISSATVTPPPPSVTASATNQALAPWLTEQCRSIMAMLATLPDDPVIRFQVLGQLAEIVARARGSPSSHQEPPAYQSQAATRTG